MFRYKKLKQTVILGLAICIVCSTAPVVAATKNNSTSSSSPPTQNISSGVTQSYNADTSVVQTGMLVELKPKDPTTVVPLPDSDIKHMLGVVVPQNNAAIVLTPQNVTTQQVLVATTGHYNVLATNQNGPIKVGDYLTISALDGVAMKASEAQSEVIGKAAGNFSGTANVIGQISLKDTLGHTSQVALGRIPLDITIAQNPLAAKSSDYVPSFLSKAAITVASKPVSAARIYLSMVLLFITAVFTGNMLYSGIRSGMIAVGRNPLSKKSIMRSLIETVIAGLIIFVAGVFAVYLLLKL